MQTHRENLEQSKKVQKYLEVLEKIDQAELDLITLRNKKNLQEKSDPFLKSVLNVMHQNLPSQLENKRRLKEQKEAMRMAQEKKEKEDAPMEGSNTK